MIAWLSDILRHHPEVTFFTTLGLGYLIGRLRWGAFSLGAVTGTLLAGVLIGQIGVTVSPDVKQCFFLLFLFSIGYRCGPQFFQGLRKDGLAQAALAAVVATTGLVVAAVVSLTFGYDPGTGAGVIAGALTESATIGTASDAISRLPVDPALRAAMTNNIPVAFAVTYLIGVVGAAWFLAQIAPRIMGVDLAQACAEYEAGLGGGVHQPGIVSAYRRFELRAYSVPDSSPFIGQPVAGLFPGTRVFIQRVRRDGGILEAGPDFRLAGGDVAAISGPRELLVALDGGAVVETEDVALLDVPIDVVDVYVTSADAIGRSLTALSAHDLARGIYLRRIVRNRVEIPILPETVINAGDLLTLVGERSNVARAVAALGVADRASDVTDMVFVAAGIVLGALIGIPALAFGNLEIGLSLSVGVLVGGLIWGWLHSVRPLVGRIPTATLWIFESLGLTGFVAVVGLAAGPDFVRGLATSGPSLIIAGILTVIVPHFVGVVVGHRVFRMHPGLLLGVCAGAGTATPALAAVQEAAKSAVPTLGYGVSYAVGNVLLALWGAVIVAILH